MLQRRRDWVTRFEKAVIERAETKFAYGVHDCGFGVIHCIAAICGGLKLASHLKGYNTLRGARWRLAKYGGLGGMAEDMAKRCGWEEVKPMFAQRGDCVLVKGDKIDPETKTDEALGIVDLSGLHILVADEIGWQEFPLAAGLRAWRVG